MTDQDDVPTCPMCFHQLVRATEPEGYDWCCDYCRDRLGITAEGCRYKDSEVETPREDAGRGVDGDDDEHPDPHAQMDPADYRQLRPKDY